VAPIVAARGRRCRAADGSTRRDAGRYGRGMLARSASLLVVLCAAWSRPRRTRAAPSESAPAARCSRATATRSRSHRPSVRRAALRAGRRTGRPRLDPRRRVAGAAEAARLIAEVDGLVEIRTTCATRGRARGHPVRSRRHRRVLRPHAPRRAGRAPARHRLCCTSSGHVVDFAIVPRALGAQLDAGIPSGGLVHVARGTIGRARSRRSASPTRSPSGRSRRVSAAGAGYAIAAPAFARGLGRSARRARVRLASPDAARSARAWGARRAMRTPAARAVGRSPRPADAAARRPPRGAGTSHPKVARGAPTGIEFRCTEGKRCTGAS
jgi:hypothetical protein